MKKILNHPLFFLAVLAGLSYCGAELIIRGQALNQVSGGIAGYVFWIGVLLLIFSWVIWPIASFYLFPKWEAPETIADCRQRQRKMLSYAKFLLHQFKKNPPPEIAGQLQKLAACRSQFRRDPETHEAEFQALLVEIHQLLSKEVGVKIIHAYMKKAALLVCISPRGMIDSLVMLFMQFRMLIDLSKALGYRPSWYFVLNCMGWVLVNSIIFALFDETEILDDALETLVPESLANSLGGTVGKMLPWVGKLASPMVQGAIAMGVIWSTGQIIRYRLLGNTQKLSARERIHFRHEGYRKALTVLPQEAWNRIFHRKKAAETANNVA